MQIRRAAPLVYAIAILLATFFGGGTALVAVAAIGAAALGLVYALLKPEHPRVRGRSRDLRRPPR